MTTFRIHNETARQIQIESIMVYKNGWHGAVGPGMPITNNINPGFHLVEAPLTIEAGTYVDVQTIFNTFVLYKTGLASDAAFLCFSVNQSNLHVGLNGEHLRHTGVYGERPGGATWEYSPSEPHLVQSIRITGVSAY